jgi:hypothetical protein
VRSGCRAWTAAFALLCSAAAFPLGCRAAKVGSAKQACAAIGLWDPEETSTGRQVFHPFVESADNAIRICDRSSEIDQVEAEDGKDEGTYGIDSASVLVSAGHGQPGYWRIPPKLFWIAGPKPLSQDEVFGVRLGNAGGKTRAAFMCACQPLGWQKSYQWSNEGYKDYYQFEAPALQSAETRVLGENLIGLCAFTTFIRCEEVAESKPFDPAAWPRADVFESFMSAGMVSAEWPKGPACLVRAAAGNKPISVAKLADFAGRIEVSTRWVARSIEWHEYWEPTAFPLPEAAPSKRPAAAAGSPDPRFDERVATARRRLAEVLGGVWTGARAVASIHASDDAGKDVVPPDVVVLIRPERQGKALLTKRPGLVWFDSSGEVKFVGGGFNRVSLAPPAIIEARNRPDFVLAATQRLGCGPGTPAEVTAGVGAEGEDLAQVDCVKGGIGGNFVDGTIFRVVLAGVER